MGDGLAAELRLMVEQEMAWIREYFRLRDGLRNI
jgi:hypothetical protein